MGKVVLISCVSKKLKTTSRAEDLYISTLFKKNLKYAKSLHPDLIFILSAKYGLLSLSDKIEDYNVTLNTMRVGERKEWADLVMSQLSNITDLENDEFIFLAGDNYRKFLIPHIKSYKIPMEGMKIGKQLQWLKNQF